MKDLSEIEKKLELMDIELHSMLSDIRSQRPKSSLTDLSKRISSSLKTDEDTTQIIRKMRV